MDDKPKQHNTPEELLQYLRERCDDIEFVAIPITPGVLQTSPDGQSRFIRNIGAVIQYFSGETDSIHYSDAESLINDGILQRLNLKVKLKPQGEQLND